jgi:catechol 2,3-dioxygenase-like lactoylglutathione lyase family enzyme
MRANTGWRLLRFTCSLRLPRKSCGTIFHLLSPSGRRAGEEGGCSLRTTLHQSGEDEPTGSSGGILHFGFELESKSDLDSAINQVISAGGALKKRGEFGPGMPFAYVADPDGYEIEL